MFMKYTPCQGYPIQEALNDLKTQNDLQKTQNDHLEVLNDLLKASNDLPEPSSRISQRQIFADISSFLKLK